MDTIDALLQAVLANPADDLPRLAYADALDERGEPGDQNRADFIRVQIENALRPDDADMAREQTAWETGHKAWCVDLPVYIREAVYHPEWWERGFLSHVEAIHDEWIEYGPDILARYPIQSVYLRDKELYVSERRMDSPWAWVRGGPVVNVIGDPIWVHLTGIRGPSGLDRRYTDPQKAWNDLSAACLLMARRKMRKAG